MKIRLRVSSHFITDGVTSTLTVKENVIDEFVAVVFRVTAKVFGEWSNSIVQKYVSFSYSAIRCISLWKCASEIGLEVKNQGGILR